ncbi:MAG: hypothetical protein K6G11_06320, partial [Lachnospiraceae bacterium]|nr:hypothetical protein [Lachnospiraceae bacterium]
MNEKQEEQVLRLIEKYAFEDSVLIGMDQYRYLAMILGVAYELSDEDIDKYMKIKTDNLAEIDLMRICIILGIEIPKGKEKNLSLDMIRNYIHGIDEKKKESKEIEKKYKEAAEQLSAKEELLQRYQLVFDNNHISLEEAEEGDILIKHLIDDEQEYSRLTNYI